MLPRGVLLSVDGGMGLHSCIAQVDFERKHAFQLGYSYIQCTDASWPASYDDANTGCCGVCPNIHLSICRGFIDSQSVSVELRKPGQGFAWGQQWSPGAGPAQGVGSGRDINDLV
ncbi:hypothetical protein MTR67_041448 [Solanum verrucosum]|uniref:Uncharacterized protein n=1 Tax=Solanum verrucosum TaxID=315347 RepID=A0AAF0ZSC8_SOLVR|nr:hypothetical protein MTR67_041448 [Solanum verrucosum]